MKKLKYIFVVGGVISGVGKGIAAASMGKILQARGLKVTAMKIDPYVNVDAGTMNPTEHGEVFVLDDGMECDQDMGNYERYLECPLSKANYMTTGSIYRDVIQKERSMGYGGKCVEVVPQVPLAIIDKINVAAEKVKADIIIIEIGGTVGEYQNILFLEAIRTLKFKKPSDVILALVSLLPAIGTGGNEIKSKPTQYAVRTLNAAGLQPDIIIGRARIPLDEKRKKTIALNCNINIENIISAPDVESIYDIPLNFEKDNLSTNILKLLKLKPRQTDLQEWREMTERRRLALKILPIAIVGKYFRSGDFMLSDVYISIIESLKHAAATVGSRIEISWLDSEDFEQDEAKLKELKHFRGILVPGGFGGRGVEGKIKVIEYARVNKIPYFGLCYGMQLAVVEFARNVLGLADANTTEINPDTKNPVIDVMPDQKEKIKKGEMGGSMRLGAYPAKLLSGTISAAAYGTAEISERHRHRYEVNPEFVAKIIAGGGVFAGTSPDGVLMEIFELPTTKHPFFVGTQFHPEFKSSPLHPHPLFLEFIKAAGKKKK